MLGLSDPADVGINRSQAGRDFAALRNPSVQSNEPRRDLPKRAENRAYPAGQDVRHG